jgi:hypothetical protein
MRVVQVSKRVFFYGTGVFLGHTVPVHDPRQSTDAKYTVLILYDNYRLSLRAATLPRLSAVSY